MKRKKKAIPELDDLVSELRSYISDQGGDFRSLEADAAERCFGDNQSPPEASDLYVEQMVEDIIKNCGGDLK